MKATAFLKRSLAASFLLALSTAALAGDKVAVGGPAPDFRLMDQSGDWHTLEDYRGKWVALYFYPKADTPGCTTEACNFRDNIFAFREMGAEIVGVSLDDVEDQKAFAEKYSLPFTLLADTEGEVAESYGVLRNYGVMKLASRESFLIDPEGRIAKHYAKVDPDTHSEEVMADLKTLMTDGPAGGR
jgi:peroxiredoxin Q/BCP